MSKGSALAVASSTAIDVVPEDRIELLRHTYGADLNHAEFDLFVHAARRLGLDPFAGQVTAVKRGGRLTIQVTIDGFRAVAEKSDLYEGQTAPMWCGEDGQWREVWLGSRPPEAARVGVYRRGFREPMIAIAAWGAYNQGNGWWKKQGGGAHMLAKCAEALALRKAFPNTLGGVYTADEMKQADADPIDTRPDAQMDRVRPAPAPKTTTKPEPEVVDAEVVEADWLEEAEARIVKAGWTTTAAAALLSERYKREGDWSKWSKSQKAVTWVTGRIMSGEEGAPPPSGADPTKADVLKHAQGLRVSPKARDGVIEHHFKMPLGDLPAENYAEAIDIITEYAKSEGAN